MSAFSCYHCSSRTIKICNETLTFLLIIGTVKLKIYGKTRLENDLVVIFGELQPAILNYSCQPAGA